jgi:hypothetical protein
VSKRILIRRDEMNVTPSQKTNRNRVQEKPLELEDAVWLDMMREMISPYWAARVVFQPETRKPMVVVDGLRKKVNLREAA